MVRAWYLDEASANKSLERHRDPPQFLSMEELYEKTGIVYYNFKNAPGNKLDKVCKSRGYCHEDEIEITKETMHQFADEHMHSDDESRLVLQGSGYLDARDATEQWVRIEITAGDMLVLPAGIYHRFTLNTENPIRLRRFFTEELEWKAYTRPSADTMPARRNYLQQALTGFTAKPVA